MLEIEISPWLHILSVPYVFFFVFNFGVAMAYLTRYEVVVEWTLEKLINIYTLSLALGLFSFFAFPSILASTSFPEHGWKLWHGEIKHPKNKWADRAAYERHKHQRFVRNMFERNTSADGLCNSIWD